MKMGLEWLVKRGILRWNSIFKTRGDVLHHLFFVLGNGYDWEDGVLQERCAEEFESLDAYQGHMQKTIDGMGLTIYTRENLFDDFHTSYRKIMNEMHEGIAIFADRLQEYQEVCENLHPRWMDNSLSSKPYPASDPPAACKFFKVPDDVQDDYLEGALQAGRAYIEAVKRRPDLWISHKLSAVIEQYRTLQQLQHQRRA